MVFRRAQSLALLLVLMYIIDLNEAIINHFNKPRAKLYKCFTRDMKNLVKRLNANKISLNVQKTGMVIFKHQRKKLNVDIKIKLSRTKLYSSQFVKYFGIKNDKNLNWKLHVNDIAVKFNRENALLIKIMNAVNSITLKTTLEFFIHILIIQIWFEF